MRMARKLKFLTSYPVDAMCSENWRVPTTQKHLHAAFRNLAEIVNLENAGRTVEGPGRNATSRPATQWRETWELKPASC